MNALLVLALFVAQADVDDEDVDDEDTVAAEADDDEDEGEDKDEAEAPPVEHEVEPLDAPAKPLADLRKDVLSKDIYKFCHEERVLLPDAPLEYCDALAKPPSEVCPAWEKICAKLDDKRPDREGVEIPSFVRWILLGLVVAAIAFLIAKLIPRYTIDPRPDDAEHLDAVDPLQQAMLEQERIVETDVARLLAMADRAAAAGNFLEAIDHSYAAVLRRLEWKNLIAVTKDSTNGDYLKEIAKNAPALRPQFRKITQEIERAHFAGEGADQDRFSRVSSWVRETLQGAAVILFFALTIGACGWNPGARETWPTGHGGLVDVLRGYGFDVHERLAPIEKFEDIDTLLLLPGARLNEDQWKTLEARTKDSRTCVVAVGGDYEWPEWFNAETVYARQDGILRARATAVEKTGQRLRVPMRRAVRPKDDEFMSVVHDDAHQYVVHRRDRCVVLVADGALFTNVAMLDDANLYVATELLRRLGKRLDIASELTGLSTNNPVEIVSRARMLPVLLQLLALLLVLYLARGAHFGTPSEPRLPVRRALSEHALAMGLLYAKARASEHAGAVLKAFRSRTWKRRA